MQLLEEIQVIQHYTGPHLVDYPDSLVVAELFERGWLTLNKMPKNPCHFRLEATFKDVIHDLGRLNLDVLLAVVTAIKKMETMQHEADNGGKDPDYMQIFAALGPILKGAMLQNKRLPKGQPGPRYDFDNEHLRESETAPANEQPATTTEPNA